VSAAQADCLRLQDGRQDPGSKNPYHIPAEVLSLLLFREAGRSPVKFGHPG